MKALLGEVLKGIKLRERGKLYRQRKGLQVSCLIHLYGETMSVTLLYNCRPVFFSLLYDLLSLAYSQTLLVISCTNAVSCFQ